MTEKTILSSIFAIALVAVAGMGINKEVNLCLLKKNTICS